MRKIVFAGIAAICLVLVMSFGALASTGGQTIQSSQALKLSYPPDTIHPDGACAVAQAGRLNGNALTVTASLSCSPGLVVGTLRTVAKHCSFSVLGVCFTYDKTVNIINCTVTPNKGTSCTGTGIIAAKGQWDVTTTAWATTSDGGTGSGSTTDTFNK